jgi:sigma-B regulation protein RsbU (phosphoserine phosphatase)
MTKTASLITGIKKPVKTYPNTLQRLAKQFWYTGQCGNILEFADEMERQVDVTAVCITDEQQRPLGIIRREQLFLALSKRFGREVMSRKTVLDCMENVLIFSGDANILLVQEHLRESPGKTDGTIRDSVLSGKTNYIVLVDSNGVFSGMLSLQDVADYMVEMTNEDIALASLLQERFLSNTDNIEDFRISVDTWWSSAKGVGGDFYFIKKIEENRFFASLCDISGKGVAAAMVVSMVWGFMRGHAMRNGLKELLTSLNESIVGSFHMEKYLTGFFMIYDRKAHLLRIADMGHAHAVFLRGGKTMSLKKTQGNLPIGVEVEINPAIFDIPIKSGDTLLIYSDGICEQDNPDGEEFGEKRIVTLAKRMEESGRKLSEILPEALNEFRLHTPQRDDMTFLLFKF